ncbi:uncharacterized protein LOC131622002 [Vicia villosa]|uniref:uncharacterized protein LOC131622002 n=1 Tax=Vicia villosa TaxID=3911 RepID=UPI00273C1E4A|nr:uncharacterized protein LOC131622002 [Vicia villosa]
MVFLMETRLKEEEAIAVKNRTKFGECFVVGCSGSGKERAGGVMLMWKDSLGVSIVSHSLNHIKGSVFEEGEDRNWNFIGIYGFPEEQNKRKTWELLMDLNTLVGEGLICFGDFNDISNNVDKQGGNLRLQAQLQWSRRAMEVCNLTEMNFEGYRFTWSNGRKDKENIQCRLDRGLVNPIFLEMFPGSKVTHLPRFGSDHAAMRIDILEKMPGEIPRRRYLFIFEEAWLKDPNCEELVRRCWREPGSNVRRKLNAIKGLQTSFREYRTGAISKELKRVEGLMRKDACWMPDSQSIAEHRAEVHDVCKVVKGKLSDEHRGWCGLPYSTEEVKDALWQMHPSKSPGPDGLPAFFFQKYWSIIGGDVTQLVLEVLNGTVNPSFMNKTFIALIPKMKNPNSPKDFRPISLCNVVMKMVTKTIANRMKRVLPDVIDEEQSAFVKGRLIRTTRL